MKIVIFVLIGVIAAAMGYFAFQGECTGGKVYTTEAECRAGGIAEAFCRVSFSEARRSATLDYAPFSNQSDCQQQFPRCEPHARAVGGFVPVPRGVCVARGEAGKPVYERFGQRLNPT
jgi:uncharacterized protein YgiB involved in biofilm formation